MKQAIILFTENMSSGFSNPHMKKIAMYLDMPRQCLRLDDLLSSRDGASFASTRDDRFARLQKLMESWLYAGISATVCRHFDSLEEWDLWRKTVDFSDSEVHWQVFIEHDDGSWTLFLELSLAFPKELEKLYRLATTLRPRKK